MEDLITQANKAKNLYKYGIISREEALALIQPYIDKVNETSTKLAKEFNTKPRYVTATGFLR